MRSRRRIPSAIMPWQLLLLLGLLAALPSAGYAQQTIVGTASVIDGDTIEVHGVRTERVNNFETQLAFNR